jgi:PhnB protein
MQLVPYLSFNGQCKTAFQFYERVLGGKITGIFTYGETPAAEHVPPEARDRVIHVRLEAGDAVLMGADSPTKYEPPRGICVSLHLKDTAQGERIFNALADGGTVQMPFEETFWAERFGMVTDRFGIPWMINCEKAA